MRRFIVLIALTIGCASTPKGEAQSTPPAPKRDKNLDKLATQAAFDLQCPPERLEIVELSHEGLLKTFGVRGCDRQGTYKLACSLFGVCTVLTESQAKLTR